MKCALVTGGAGYLAHSLVKELRGRYRIRRMHRPGNPPADPPGPGVEDFAGDVRNRADLEKALEGVDTVFHLAAQTSVYVAEENPSRDYDANVTPLLHLLDICRNRQPGTCVLFAGTATQTGIPTRLPVDETHADNPVTVYDRHKLMAEQRLLESARQGFVRGASLRLTNVYGPGPIESNAGRGVLNRMIRKALAGETLTVYGDGGLLRDYLHVRDAARAFALAAEHAEAVNGKHFITATGTGTTLAEAARLVAKLAEERTGKPVRVEHVEPPEGLSPIEFRNYVGDASALRKATGWGPRVALEEGVGKMSGAGEVL